MFHIYIFQIPVKIEVPDVPPEGTSTANEEPMPDDGDIDIQVLSNSNQSSKLENIPDSKCCL